MNKVLITGVIFACIAFILLGIAMNFAPEMLAGFEATRIAPNVSEYTALDTVISFGPTIILLGFIIAVGVGGFMGIAIGGYQMYKGRGR